MHTFDLCVFQENTVKRQNPNKKRVPISDSLDFERSDFELNPTKTSKNRTKPVPNRFGIRQNMLPNQFCIRQIQRQTGFVRFVVLFECEKGLVQISDILVQISDV